MNFWVGRPCKFSSPCLNRSYDTIPTAITKKKIITNPSDIATSFNNYFAKVAIDIQSPTRFSKSKYFDYISPVNIKSFLITPTDSSEVFNITSFLKPDKSNASNSITTETS